MKEKTRLIVYGLIICGIVFFGFVILGITRDYSLMNKTIQKNNPEYSIQPVSTEVSFISIHLIPDYFIGEPVVISGTTTLPLGELIDIAITKEPYHFTKCEPGTFCGYTTYSTRVKSGERENTWSIDLNTTEFTEGGYDVWVVPRYNPNISVHTGLNLKEK